MLCSLAHNNVKGNIRRFKGNSSEPVLPDRELITSWKFGYKSLFAVISILITLLSMQCANEMLLHSICKCFSETLRAMWVECLHFYYSTQMNNSNLLVSHEEIMECHHGDVISM